MTAIHFLFALALAPAPPAGADWTFVTENETLRSAVETSTIRREGETVSFWTERRFRKTQELGGHRFNVSRHVSEADCRSLSTRVMEVDFFLDEVEVVIPLNPDPEPMQPPPGSVVAQELELACRRPCRI
jgi:hypothetical protein